MWKANCNCNPNHFVVYPLLEPENEDEGVLVQPDGEVTNRWYDGTVGVPKNVRDIAADEESAACPVCGTEATWEK